MKTVSEENILNQFVHVHEICIFLSNVIALRKFKDKLWPDIEYEDKYISRNLVLFNIV